MTNESTLALTEAAEAHFAELAESYAALSAELQLMRDDVGWLRLGAESGQFGKADIDEIANLSRLMYVKNPLIRRSVEVTKDYVFAQGVSVFARHPEINAVLQAFWDNRRHREVLTSQLAMMEKEKERQTDGNLFIVLFTNRATGRVRMRDIPMEHITEIITNPDDNQEVWFYRRKWTVKKTDGTTESRDEFYPDWLYAPDTEAPTYGGTTINWDAPIYHAKSGGFSAWQFGLSSVYAGIDWARAYKGFLEDWATITKALARFAFKAKVSKGAGARGVAAVKARLNSTLNTSDTENNPPPAAGSTLIQKEGYDFEPMKTAGATTSMDDGRRLLLMVAASAGLPETFYGDASVGSLATARSLDRPTELMMRSVQSWWSTLFVDVCSYVVMQAVKAPGGALRGLGTVEWDEDDHLETIAWEDDPETDQPINATIDVTWPPIIEIDPAASIAAINAAAAFIPDERTIARLVLGALGEENIDELLDRMFPAEGDAPDDEQDGLDREVAEAVREVKAVVAMLREVPG